MLLKGWYCFQFHNEEDAQKILGQNLAYWERNIKAKNLASIFPPFNGVLSVKIHLGFNAGIPFGIMDKRRFRGNCKQVGKIYIFYEKSMHWENKWME